ncbi:MAG: type 4a pilus biogenesis protein PilO [Gaiellaceae bacterium]
MPRLTKPKTQVNTKALAAVGAGLLAFAAAGYLLAISPQRSKAKDLTTQIVAAQQQLSVAQLQSQVKPPTDPRVDELFRLTRAMPATTDMPGILLELARVAEETGITFNSITPAQPTAAASYQALPIEVTFGGNYYELSDFIFRLNNLVAQRDGKLNVNGRLFTVNSVDFSKGEGVNLGATISTTAYVYGTGTTATAPAPVTPAPATPAPATPPAAATPTAGGS